MGHLAAVLIYGLASGCGAVITVYSLWRISIRLPEGNAWAVTAWGAFGLIALVGMVSHYRMAWLCWHAWRR